MIRRLALFAALFAGLQVLFLGLLVVAQAVPDEPIVDHLVEADEAGEYGPSPRSDGMGGIAASFTECVVLGTGLGRPDASVWERTMRVPRIGSCGAGPEQLRRLQRGEPVDGVEEYFRYWSGYTIVTRPVLALWGIGALRMLCGGLMAVAGVGLVIAVSRRASTAYLAALFLPLLVATNLLSFPSTALQQALAAAAAFTSAGLAAFGAARGPSPAVAAAIVGAAVYNYVDVLSTPAIPWALSTAVAGAVVYHLTRSTPATLRTSAVVALAWIVGFGLTWAARWTIAIAALGWGDASDVIFDKVGFRVGGETSGADSGVAAATRANVRYWFDEVPTAWPVVVLGLVVIAIALFVALRRDRGRWAPFAVLAAPALLVFLWYEALRNHSLIHVPKTYASLAVALGIVVAAAVLVATPPADRVRPPNEPHPTAW